MKTKLKAKLLLSVFSLSVVFGFVGNNFASAIYPHEQMIGRLMTVTTKLEKDPRCAELKKFLETKGYAEGEEPHESPEERDSLRCVKIKGYINAFIEPYFFDSVSVAVYAALMNKSEDEVREMFIRDDHEKSRIELYERRKTGLLAAAKKFADDPRCVALIRYLESEEYMDDECIFVPQEENFNMRAIKIYRYVNANFVYSSKDEVSVVIYAALMEKDVEGARQKMIYDERKAAEFRQMIMDNERKAAKSREEEKANFETQNMTFIKGSKTRLLKVAHALSGDVRCQELIKYLESKKYRDPSLPESICERNCFVNISNYISDHFAPNPSDEASVVIYAVLMSKARAEVKSMFEAIANSEGVHRLIGRLRLAMARIGCDPRCQRLSEYLSTKGYIDEDDACAIEVEGACTKTPEWGEYISHQSIGKICDYINSNFKTDPSDSISVAIFAAMTDRKCEDMVKEF